MPRKKLLTQTTTGTDGDIALRQSEGDFDTLVSGVEDYAIFLLSREGRVATWNAGAQRIKGYNSQEIIGKHFSIFFPPVALERGLPADECWMFWIAVSKIMRRYSSLRSTAQIANAGSFSRSGFQTKGLHRTVESLENPTDLGRPRKPLPPPQAQCGTSH